MLHLLFEDLIKVSNNLIEKAQALDTLIVGLKLDVELGEVGDGGEDDAPAVALLVVQLLRQVWSISISISIVSKSMIIACRTVLEGLSLSLYT